MILSLSRHTISRTAAAAAFRWTRPAASSSAILPTHPAISLSPSQSQAFFSSNGDKTLNRDAIADILCAEYGLKMTESKRILATVFDTIVESVSNKEIVTIPGFGKFEPIERPPREYNNPITKQKVWKPATTLVKFRAFKHFKDCVAAGKVAQK
mmetsp:Transcript_41346/g.86790  ORF Transcript_41346/g.86790 Transcript_41346/m.86790 type:complete len:154 (-) Transcript_41346:339-800(-)